MTTWLPAFWHSFSARSISPFFAYASAMRSFACALFVRGDFRLGWRRFFSRLCGRLGIGFCRQMQGFSGSVELEARVENTETRHAISLHGS